MTQTEIIFDDYIAEEERERIKKISLEVLSYLLRKEK